MALKEVVIVSAARTAIGKFMGTLKDVSARDLAITAAKGAIERSGIPADKIDEICMGQLYTGMQGSLPARQVSMRVGLPHSSSAHIAAAPYPSTRTVLLACARWRLRATTSCSARPRLVWWLASRA